MEKKIIRWGLLGAGAIIDRWIHGARMVEDMQIVAVASRTPESARRMADKYGIPEVNTYSELLARPDIDVVYIPVPHTAHKALAIQAMNAGKSVLVEKPGAVTAADFQEMADCAKRNRVFLMEAVWTRFFPLMDTVKQLIADGKIGVVRMLQCDFCYRTEDNYVGRVFAPETAGGGLLDVGVYNLHFADMILEKEPISLHGTVSIDTDHLHLQVDEQEAYIAQYDGGELAVMTSAVRTELPCRAAIYGTKGSITMDDFFRPTKMVLNCGGKTEEIAVPVPQKSGMHPDEGFQYELIHVNDCLRKGIIESTVMDWETSMRILSQCDDLRRQWNYQYPFEK